jgi:long-chain acyl-CoA synthetase
VNLASLLDRAADATPSAPAIVGDPTRSWAELRARVARLAGGLAGLGVTRGARIAVLGPNSPAHLEAHLALARLGAIVVPLNTRLAPGEIGAQLEDAGVGRWLVDETCAGAAEAAAPSLPRVTIAAGSDTADWRRLLSAPPAGEIAAVAAGAPLGIFYTGGTTGRSKGVVLTHGNLLSNAANVVPAIGFTAADVHLHAAPMFHLADLGYLWALLAVGAAHAFLPAWSPAAFVEAVARRRVTATLLAPSMITALVRSAAGAARDLGSWRRLMYGGSPITEDTLRRALAALPCRLWQGYGQTEATHTICLLTADDHVAAGERPARLRSCGRPIGGVEARVAGADDTPVAPGATGEVIARGPTIMPGYWNRPAETAETLRGGWLRTGDLATVDAEGYVYLLGRRHDMIVSGGENVYPAEVERALAAHPAVLEAAVIGVPDEAWGERVHAVVVLTPGRTASEADLQRHCRRLIGGFKIPRSFEFVATLPRTSTGKVAKAALREPHWQSHPRQIH